MTCVCLGTTQNIEVTFVVSFSTLPKVGQIFAAHSAFIDLVNKCWRVVEKLEDRREGESSQPVFQVEEVGDMYTAMPVIRECRKAAVA